MSVRHDAEWDTPLEWDYENRLQKIGQEPQGGSNPPSNPGPYRFFLPIVSTDVPGYESYSYDGDGNRVKKVTSDTTTYYIEPHYEIKVQGGQAKATKYYAFNGQRLLMRLPDGSLNYLHADHLGSVVLVTGGNGAIVGNNQPRYDAFGAERIASVASLPTELSFTGQRRDGSGLMYFGARYYDPALGTFISADSIVVRPGDPASLNRYAFAANNPLRYADPTGHDIQDVLHTVNEFGKGVVKQWGYNNAWLLPATQDALQVQEGESEAMLAGRLVANVASVVQGAGEMIGGAGLAAGGGTYCAATAGIGCVLGGGAIVVAGGAVAFNGAAVAGTALGSTPAVISNLMMAKGNGNGGNGLPSREDLSSAAGMQDRNGLTHAGRSLQKQSDRVGSKFAKPSGKLSAENYNQAGQTIVDEILNNVNSTWTVANRKYYGDVIEIRVPDGRGLRYDINGNWIGFLD